MPRPNAKILILCIAVFTLAGMIAWGVFEAMPHLEDEHATLFQAQVFASGRVTVAAPRHPESFFIPFVINSADGKRFGKYPPGYPLLLALGVALGQSWLVNALAAALGIFGVYLLGRDLFDRDTGLLAAALGAISPMFVLLSGTLLSHATSIAALTFFAWAFVRARRAYEARRARFALLAGALLGLAAIIRPWTALAVAFPFVLLASWDMLRSRGRDLPVYGAMALAVALICSIQVWFNLAATGSPIANTYTMWWSYDVVGFGLGHGRDVDGHTLRKGLSNTVLDLAEFPAGLFGWPEPSGVALAWLPLGLGLVWPAPRCNDPTQSDERRKGTIYRAPTYRAPTYRAPTYRAPTNDDRTDLRPSSFVLRLGVLRGFATEWGLLLPTVALVAAQAAYWARGSSLYGPRYYAEAMPFLWIIAARGLIKFAAGKWRRRAVMLALPVLLAWSIIFTLEPRALQGRGLFDISRQDANTIAAAGPHNALIFVHSDYWTAYASLSWLNALTLDGDVIYAKDRGPVENAQVIGDYPGRAVYYYERGRQPALRSEAAAR